MNVSCEHDANPCKETGQKSISLPETEETISTMLKELYNIYNPTTGSIFTNFALRREIEKESVMSSLLMLFIACDKVRSFSSIQYLPLLTMSKVQPRVNQEEGRSFLHRPLTVRP
jgi:hypothetical protein